MSGPTYTVRNRAGEVLRTDGCVFAALKFMKSDAGQRARATELYRDNVRLARAIPPNAPLRGTVSWYSTRGRRGEASDV